MSVEALDFVVGKYFEGTDKSVVMNTVIGGVNQGLPLNSINSILRTSGLHFANYKLSEIYRQTISQYGSTLKLRLAGKDTVLAYPYGTMGYEYQKYNYIYQVKIKATFKGFSEPFEYYIAHTSDVPLTKNQIFNRVKADLQDRMFAPTSDYGELNKVLNMSVDKGLIRPDIFAQSNPFVVLSL